MQPTPKLPLCIQCYKPFDPDNRAHSNFGFAEHFCSLNCSTVDWQIRAHIPLSFREIDFTRLKCIEQIEAVEDWRKLRDCHKGLPGLLCHGVQSGTGKTRVSTDAVCRMIAGNWMGNDEESLAMSEGCGSSGFWFNALKFKTEYLSVHRDGEARGKWTELLAAADVLFIDDCDKIKPSEGMLELLFALLDERLTNGRTTVLTTNATGERLERLWGEEHGPYLVRRLREFCLCVNFDLPSNVIAIQQSA